MACLQSFISTSSWNIYSHLFNIGYSARQCSSASICNLSLPGSARSDVVLVLSLISDMPIIKILYNVLIFIKY